MGYVDDLCEPLEKRIYPLQSLFYQLTLAFGKGTIRTEKACGLRKDGLV